MSMDDLKGGRILILNVPDNLTPAIESAIATMEDAGLTVVRLGEAMEAFRHIKNERLATGLREALIVHKSEQAFDCNPWPTTRPNDKTSATINFVIRDIEQVPDVKIDKTKDRFSFADHFVGRGKRRNR